MANEGILIPNEPEGSPEILDDLRTGQEEQIGIFENMMEFMSGVYTGVKEGVKQNSERNDKLDNVLDNQEDANNPRLQKMKDKMSMYWDKVRKGKWFEKSLKSLVAIVRSSGGWIIKLLGALMALAIFDPSGSFMSSIITMLAGLAITIVTAIARMLPGLVKTMANLLPMLINVVLKAVTAVVGAIIQSLPQIADALVQGLLIIGQELPKLIIGLVEQFARLIPVLIPQFVKVFLTLIKVVFKLLPQIFQSLAKLIPVVMQTIAKELPKIFSFIVEELPKFIMALVNMVPVIIDAFVNNIDPFINALVAATPLIIEALVIAAPQIAIALWRAMDSIITKLLPKLVIGLFKVGDAAIQGLASGLAKNIDEYGPQIQKKFSNVMGGVQEEYNKRTKLIKTSLKKVQKDTIDFFKKFVKFFKEGFEKVVDGVKNLGRSMSNTMSEFFSVDNIKDMLRQGVDNIFGRGTFSNISKKFNRIFNRLTSRLQFRFQRIVDKLTAGARIMGMLMNPKTAFQTLRKLRAGELTVGGIASKSAIARKASIKESEVESLIKKISLGRGRDRDSLEKAARRGGTSLSAINSADAKERRKLIEILGNSQSALRAIERNSSPQKARGRKSIAKSAR